MTDSKEIIRVFRSYNKEKGWPMAHAAADLIEKLEAENLKLHQQLADQEAEKIYYRFTK